MNARRARLLPLIGALACAAAAPELFVACERHADLRDEPDSSFIAPTPTLDAGDVPDLDAGLRSDAYAACADRPAGNCQGPIDFPCDFEGWVILTAETCQNATGCVTDGWLEVKLASDGCASVIGMSEPNDAIVACLLAELGAVRCPCGALEYTYYFGEANSGCPEG